MDGFIVRYKDEETSIAELNGISTIHISYNGKDRLLYSGSMDSETSTSRMWHNFLPLEYSDRIEIEAAEIIESSSPIAVEKLQNKPNIISKLDIFLKLERSLRERGLL